MEMKLWKHVESSFLALMRLVQLYLCNIFRRLLAEMNTIRPNLKKKTFGQHSIGCTRKVESFRVQKINWKIVEEMINHPNKLKAWHNP